MNVYDNTPSQGYISWSNVNISYKGQTYQIADGNTNLTYIYWKYADPDSFYGSNTYPTLTDDDILVFVNKDGVHLTVPNTTVLDGSLLVPESVVANALAANSVTTEKIVAGAITTTTIAANAVGANQIAASAITTDKLAAGAVNTSKIASNAITADKIAAGAITADKLDANAINGKTISGVTINTSTLNGASGTFSGDLTTGYLIIGQDSPNFGWYEDGVNAVEFKNPVRVSDGVYQWGDSFFIKVGNNEVHLNGLNVIVDDTLIANSLSATTIIGSPKFSGDVDFQNHNIENVNQLIFNDPGVHEGLVWNGGNGWEIYESPNDLSNDKGNMQFVCGGNRLLTIGTDGALNSLPTYNRTYSYSANMYVTSNGYFGRVTSALKYKTDVEEVDLSNGYAERILQLKPKSWHDKAQLERYNSGEDIHLDRIYGLIAEDVEQVGLSEYVTYAYDENGIKETEGLQYDRLWTLLIPITKDHRDKINMLLEQNSQLISKCANLEERLSEIESKMEVA